MLRKGDRFISGEEFWEHGVLGQPKFRTPIKLWHFEARPVSFCKVNLWMSWIYAGFTGFTANLWVSWIYGKTLLRKESRFRNKPGEQGGSQPVSRVLSRTIIHLGCTSPYTSSSLPGDNAGHIIAPLFGLAPGGVYHAVAVASHAVRSYRTISPLPGHLAGRYTFCCTFRRLAPPRNYLAPCPCGARTFLCRTGIDKKSIRSDSDCPADSR